MSLSTPRSLPSLFPLLLVLLFHPGGRAAAGIDARLLRYPDVSESQVAFVYGGDIWVVGKEGGNAHRLSTPAGEESFPRFSPDGRWLAFSGNYDGNTDIYVMPVAGGVPQRLTHHPMADRLLDWYPDGESILFATSMHSGKQRFRQLYRLAKDGGHPQQLPVPYGEFGSISADGRTLVYMPHSRDFRTWKRYRGGMASKIWLFDLVDHSSQQLAPSDANDTQPMWHGVTVYFQSDRDQHHKANLWAYDTEKQQLRQVTNFAEYDVRFPSIGPHDLVFENGGRLHRLDLATEEHVPVAVEVVTDQATLKPRLVEVADLIQGAGISPSAKRAVFQARGDLYTAPAEHGPVRSLTRTSGIAERHPAWSPDGEEIAYWSDRSGDYELTVRPAGGDGVEQTLTRLGPGYRYQPYWSPDSKKIAFIDQTMAIQIFDRDRDEVKEVDRGLFMLHGSLSGFEVSWSSDSRWLAYARDLEHRNRAIFLYDTVEGERHRVTSGFYDDRSPVFDPEGEYLYLLTTRHFRPSYSNLDNSWIYANATQIAAVPLRTDVPSPLAARNDEEPDEDADEDEGDEEDGEDGEDEEDGGGGAAKGEEDASSQAGRESDAKEKKGEEPEPVEIDLEGFERRLVVLPPKAGNFSDLAAVAGKVLYHRRPNTGSGSQQSPLVYYDLEEREEETVVEDVDGFVLAAGSDKALVAKDRTFAIIDLKPAQKLEKPLRTAAMTTQLDPSAEWRQMFNEAWRLQRDYFYDPGLHGVDWDEMGRRYGQLLRYAVTRWDVNYLIGELIAELNASHTYRGGGDTEDPPRQSVGLLGADYRLENGAYRIAKIVDGAAWDSEVRSPLAEPGVEVKQGDYLLAVNGVPIDTARDIWASFQGLGEKTVLLHINDEPTLEGAREVLVKTLSSETRLRNLAWIEEKRRFVEEATGGRVGYLYVPSTGIDGQTELVRMFMGQFMKEGLIVDERFNNGGQIPDRFVELLDRPLLSYWGVRDGKDWQWPPVAHHGPKVMLVNEWSGSGGDAFPFYFREAGLGPLIGTRTWGGLIGISGAPGLIDGGGVTVPTFGIYSTDGQWIIEGHGVEPDIEVLDDPALMTDGGDPQLERAVAEALRRLDERPPQRPRKPDYPVRTGS